MRAFSGLIVSAMVEMALASSASAGDSGGSGVYCCRCRANYHRGQTAYLRDRRFDRHYYWPPLTFRGGWYALNYPYYWGYGPTVGYYDPYDANGNYFPYPLPRR